MLRQACCIRQQQERTGRTQRAAAQIDRDA